MPKITLSQESSELMVKVLKEALHGSVSSYNYPSSKREVFSTLKREGLLQSIGDITGSETSNSYKITEQGIRYLHKLSKKN